MAGEKTKQDALFIFCTEKDEKTGNILLSPPLGEESIVIKSEDDVKMLINCLMGMIKEQEGINERT